jgi:sirohydrochlorin ferrochelatase
VSRPALVAVAHGSAHPAAANAIGALAGQVSRLAPTLDVKIAFVQHAEPSLTDVLAQAGPSPVLVPLLLSTGYHLTRDIAPAANTAGAQVTQPLGPDPLLTVALRARLAEAGARDRTSVVLAAAGSAEPTAAKAVVAQASLLADALAIRVIAAFAATPRVGTTGLPTVSQAVACLRSESGGPVAVATYLLAPGQFHDRLSKAGADWVTAPLGAHPAVAALVIDRYRTAA